MIAWAKKRKSLYMASILVIFIIWVFVFVVPRVRMKPTCFDSVQNGNETGVDCGGSCSLYCSSSAVDLSTVWSRSFKVIPGRYNAVAFVENQNADAAISEIDYEFKLYDENNIFIARRTGTTYILPNNKTAIFEAGILTGDRTPVRTDFTFTEVPLWLQVPRETSNSIAVVSKNIVMRDPFTNPTITATIQNNSKFDLFDFDVVAILYNGENNVIAASQTFVELLPEASEYEVFFTWQDTFVEEPVRIEILPQINLFQQNNYR